MKKNLNSKLKLMVVLTKNCSNMQKSGADVLVAGSYIFSENKNKYKN